jgi:hypothetical protein
MTLAGAALGFLGPDERNAVWQSGEVTASPLPAVVETLHALLEAACRELNYSGWRQFRGGNGSSRSCCALLLEQLPPAFLLRVARIADLEPAFPVSTVLPFRDDALQVNNTAGSGLGSWYLAKAKALSVGLSNAYFKSFGLPSLIDE